MFFVLSQPGGEYREYFKITTFLLIFFEISSGMFAVPGSLTDSLCSTWLIPQHPTSTPMNWLFSLTVKIPVDSRPAPQTLAESLD